MEKLIKRIRSYIDYDFSIKEIIEALSKEHSQEDIFLAYHAAKILSKNP